MIRIGASNDVDKEACWTPIFVNEMRGNRLRKLPAVVLVAVVILRVEAQSVQHMSSNSQCRGSGKRLPSEGNKTLLPPTRGVAFADNSRRSICLLLPVESAASTLTDLTSTSAPDNAPGFQPSTKDSRRGKTKRNGWGPRSSKPKFRTNSPRSLRGWPVRDWRIPARKPVSRLEQYPLPVPD